jgi:NADH-quinone oxidoreductase subunit G
MIATAKPDLVTVNIDGKEIAVPKGTNVIEAARLVNVDVPHYCYHPKLTIVGNCRMCLIEMGMPAVDPATKAPIMDPATGQRWVSAEEFDSKFTGVVLELRPTDAFVRGGRPPSLRAALLERLHGSWRVIAAAAACGGRGGDIPR